MNYTANSPKSNDNNKEIHSIAKSVKKIKWNYKKHSINSKDCRKK